MEFLGKKSENLLDKAESNGLLTLGAKEGLREFSFSRIEVCAGF